MLENLGRIALNVYMKMKLCLKALKIFLAKNSFQKKFTDTGVVERVFPQSTVCAGDRNSTAIFRKELVSEPIDASVVLCRVDDCLAQKFVASSPEVLCVIRQMKWRFTTVDYCCKKKSTMEQIYSNGLT